MNSWIFQYNPTAYDLDSGLRRGLRDWWAMNQNYRDALIGDTVYFLRSGYGSAVTAMGNIVRATYARETKYGTFTGQRAVDVAMSMLVEPELPRDTLRQNPQLGTLPLFTGGGRGTNFKLTVEQADALRGLVNGRLLDAASAIATRQPQPALKRSETALGRSPEAIRTFDGKVVAVQVQFTPNPGDNERYRDRLLANGEIELIGRGKPRNGDQQATHGNAALMDAVRSTAHAPFPVYEKWFDNRYRYLGQYVVTAHHYEELVDNSPGYKVYRFTLTPMELVALDGVPRDEILHDFEDDIAPGLAPERRARITMSLIRDRALAERVKKEAGYRCQRCSVKTSWVTARGLPYVEVHHVIPLGQAGSDNENNMVALCANCHRLMHLAKNADSHREELRTKLAI